MEHKKGPAKEDKALAINPASIKRVAVVRLDMNKGSLTHSHRHERECMLIVLHGVCRVYLQDRMVTLRENEMLHIPPQHEHVAEAVADTVMLSISAADSEWAGCGPVMQHDADQYLWGV
jgi:quercetin dioxygenase-like cupin family protein